MSKVRVVAAVVDTIRLTMYKEDGSTVIINQGDPSLEPIMTLITPILSTGGVAEVDLSAYGADQDKPQVNEFAEFEKKSGGLVKLFRVAKSKIASLFGAKDGEDQPKQVKHVAPQTLGKAPSTPEAKANTKAVAAETAVAKNVAAVAEVLKNAKPVATVKDEPLEDHETVVAVVKDSKGNEQVIAGVEALSEQFKHSINGSSKGIENFIKRITEVISQRRHSVDDLMKFMKRGDLPVADNGDIVIYKILRKRTAKAEGINFTYVDCHSQNVFQRVGSYVHMDHSLVDHNRNNECSNGLHVARRQYLGQFSGDVVVLATVRPEDVIAVPQYDANKMRVCGYHILFEMNEEDRRELLANRPLKTEDGKAKLGKALAGDHIGVLENVKIGGHRGTNISVTRLIKDAARIADEHSSNVVQNGDRKASALAIEEDKKLKQVAPAMDPKAVAKIADAAKAATQSAAPLSRAEQAQKLWLVVVSQDAMGTRLTALETLLSLKKKAKVGWDSLGIDIGQVQQRISELKPIPQGKVDRVKEAANAPATAVQQSKEVAKMAIATTPREKIAALLARPGQMDRLLAKQVVGVKRDAKKGWSALGVTDEALIKRMEKLAKD